MFTVRLPTQEQVMLQLQTQVRYTRQPLKLPLGTVVFNDEHGRGTITAYNNHPSPWYGRSKYPYFVRFDSGHQDVYSARELDW